MRTRTNAGFTLVEMMMAMAITATVAVSAMAALDQLVDADARARQNLEDAVGVWAALQSLRHDVVHCKALTVRANECQAVQHDGSVVVYRVFAGGTELHRTVAANLAAVPAMPADSLAPIGYTARGHMRDADYRADAVLQGARSITFLAIAGPRSGDIVGLKATIAHVSPHGKQITDGIAASLALLEADAKP